MVRILNFPGSTRILDFCESMIEWLAIYVSIEFVKIFKAEFANLERLSGCLGATMQHTAVNRSAVSWIHFCLMDVDV